MSRGGCIYVSSISSRLRNRAKLALGARYGRLLVNLIVNGKDVPCVLIREG
jgi:hypothetical protein